MVESCLFLRNLEFQGNFFHMFWQDSQAFFSELFCSELFCSCCCLFFVLAMRFLGIPCRSVTNFDSAHDTDANVTHDVYFDEELNYDKERTNDSVW